MGKFSLFWENGGANEKNKEEKAQQQAEKAQQAAKAHDDQVMQFKRLVAQDTAELNNALRRNKLKPEKPGKGKANMCYSQFRINEKFGNKEFPCNNEADAPEGDRFRLCKECQELVNKGDTAYIKHIRHSWYYLDPEYDIRFRVIGTNEDIRKVYNAMRKLIKDDHFPADPNQLSCVNSTVGEEGLVRYGYPGAEYIGQPHSWTVKWALELIRKRR